MATKKTTQKKNKPAPKKRAKKKATKKVEVAVITLTPKQEKFCQLYASDREFFGNGTQSYIEAYDVNMSRPGAYKSAMASASRLLSNVKILQRIDELMEITLNDAHVDKQLGFWITQKASPQASVAAIKEYNALKQRVVKKIDATLHGDPAESLVKFIGEDDEKPAKKTT
jgi:phage terminase small subunit